MGGEESADGLGSIFVSAGGSLDAWCEVFRKQESLCVANPQCYRFDMFILQVAASPDRRGVWAYDRGQRRGRRST